MEVTLVNIKKEERYIVENLFFYYVYDMSEFMGWNPDQSGQFSFDASCLDLFWEKADHIPFFIHVDNQLAGFALIRRYPSDPSYYDVAQFFVLRKFNGQGVGKEALAQVIQRYPGKWQIRVLLENSKALSFWKSAVFNIVADNYQLGEAIDVDLLMHFIHFEAVR